ncbi:NADPH-dependent FMN reductase [Tuberibacillus sp. Marseille-P3662]|uniref:NADPH-dependent FMN reductase n=1 Tax=Tuberibacillus sp. Marseille-P3662 TaxID=1965358 RepID=UPI000A1CD36B|nr:NAD(P)H-dependent oxidoreductase [Tuberibacillus sp. Marseille-P3662]
MKLLGISGSAAGSKTALTVQHVLQDTTKQQTGTDVELLDLKDYQVQFCDGRDPFTYKGDTKTVIDKVLAADAFVIGSPVYQGSITGALKNLFDVLPMAALRHKVVGIIANGGSPHHYLAVENQLRPILSYFRSYIAPGYTYVLKNCFDNDNQLIDPTILERISILAQEIVTMHQALNEN